MINENAYQPKLILKIRNLLPGCIILKNDPNYIQAFPDLLILYKNKWAALETKRETNASRRPGQDYYIRKLNNMSYAAFVYPENEEEILNELQQAFGSSRRPRVS
jgi:hypothetical protein